jgi:tight adherence protein B
MNTALADAGAAPLLLLLAGCAALTVLLLLVALLGGDKKTPRNLKRRMAAVRARSGADAGAVPLARARRAAFDTKLPTVDKLMTRYLPRRAALIARLEATGKNISVSHYVMACLLLGLTAAALAIVLAHLPAMLALFCGLTLGIGLPHFVVGRMAKRRLQAFIGLFPEAIDLIVRGLKSGLPITESIATVGHEVADPVGMEFRRLDQSIKLGQPFDEALGAAVRRLGTPEFKFFVISLGVQRETGGNLAETLENLSDILRRRRQMQMKVKAMSSEARASAMIIGSLPFIMVALLSFVSPAYLMALVHDPRGWVMVGGGAISMTIGILVMAKMVQFEI